MDRKVIASFQKALEAKHRQLRVSLAKAQREARGTQHDFGKDEGDRAVSSTSREIDASQKSRDRALLTAVDAALKRIKDSTFGACLNCGQEIGIKRLQAIPWVRYCIVCQELMDKTR